MLEDMIEGMVIAVAVLIVVTGGAIIAAACVYIVAKITHWETVGHATLRKIRTLVARIHRRRTPGS